MDVFYRGYDPAAPITSAAQHVAAAAARMALSIVESIAFLPEATWQELQRLLTVEHLWGFCLVLAGWLIATGVGGVIGAAVNAVLIGYGLKELWERLGSLGATLRTWADAFYHAQSEKDLQAAGKSFAEALSAGGLAVLELVLTHKAFRLAEEPLLRRFPVPAWLRGRFSEALRKRERARAASPEMIQKKPQGPLPERINRLGAQIPMLPVEGARRVARAFPTVPVVAGVMGSLVAGGALCLALSSPGRRAR